MPFHTQYAFLACKSTFPVVAFGRAQGQLTDLVKDDADNCHNQAVKGDRHPRHKQQLLAAGVLGKVGLVQIICQLQPA